MRITYLYLLCIFIDFFINCGNQLSVDVQGQGQTIIFDSESADKYLDHLIKTENIKEKTLDGATPLMLAANFNLVDKARILFTQGADIDICHPRYGVTGLTIAAGRHSMDIVRLLMCSAKDRISGVVVAAESGYISILRLFFSYPLLETKSRKEKDTALIAAARAGKGSTINFLLDHGADINCITPDNFTPLSCALLFKQRKVAELLINRGGIVPDISWCASENPKFEIQIKEQNQPAVYLLKKSSLVSNLIDRYRNKYHKVRSPLHFKKDDWLFYQQGDLFISEECEEDDFILVTGK